jgi:hypothetical protein
MKYRSIIAALDSRPQLKQVIRLDPSTIRRGELAYPSLRE